MVWLLSSSLNNATPTGIDCPMNWNDLLAAFALYLVFEGIIPFANPAAFRQFVQQMASLPDVALRRFGFASMALGLGILYLVRS